MNTFFKNKIVWSIGAILAILFSFVVGFYVGNNHSGNYSVSSSENGNPKLSNSSNVDLTQFWQVWNILNTDYVQTHASTTDSTSQRVYGAIEGMVASLGDPYTVFFPPSDSAIFNSEVSGNFQGIGLEIGIQDGNIVAVSALKNTPAASAGIRPGDIIEKIDGQTTEGISTDEAVKLIRGQSGTPVTLTLLRDTSSSSQPFDVKIIRQNITIPTLDTTTKPGGIFVISLYNFSEDSANLFRAALRQFVASGDTKLILDLRGNPGGYLDAAVDMASWFLPTSDVVVSEHYGGSKPDDVYKSIGYDIFNKNLKMIILIDGGSASASEILSGALSQNGVAELVGEKSFGKGSVQELLPLAGGAELKVTVARWLTPNGTSISDHGLTPDVVVPMTDQDILAGKDPQMDKAVSILQSE